MTYIRPVTERMAYALRNRFPRGLFVAIEHPSGIGRFCSGVGKKTWNGYEWSGTGTLGSITPVKRSSEIAVQEITFTINGVKPDIAAQVNDIVRNLNGSVWLACFGADGKVVPDPYRLVDSELNYQAMERRDDGSVTISIIANSGFYTLAKSIDEAWTPQNQKLTYPDDTGLDMVPLLQKQDLQWTPVAP